MIKVGIVGYGNLGKACERVLQAQVDMEPVVIISRRKVTSPFNTPTALFDDIKDFRDKVDIMLLCGGSATDLLKQSNEVIKHFNTADSFDTHALMNKHFTEMDAAAMDTGHIALIATGWDPGLFSTMRVLFDSIMSDGKTFTFWGKGVSQGHSEAIRRLDGVKYGIQYTVPKQEAVGLVRDGLQADLSARQMHERVCYVVADEGADREKIRQTIVNMPNYFADYDTTVNFIDEEEFLKNHTSMPHGGNVIRAGEVNGNNTSTEFSIKLSSNPDFTASVLVAYARAAVRMHKEGKTGAITVFDVPVSYLSIKSSRELIKTML